MRKFILAPMALACLICSAVAQQAPSINVGNFPADPATGTRQDTGNTNTAAIAAATGTTGDAAYAGSGAGSVISLNKGQYAILSNLYAAAGAAADTASATTGANGSQIALLKALRDKLNGTLTVSGTTATSNGALDATITARLGLLGQKTASASAPVVLASDQPSVPTKIDQTTPGSTNRVFVVAGQPTVISTTPLAASAAAPNAPYFTGMGAGGSDPYQFAYYTCSAFADQAGTLYVESSLDNTTFFPRNNTAGTAVAAGISVDVKVPLSSNVIRCRFVNGPTAQTKFFLSGNPSRN